VEQETPHHLDAQEPAMIRLSCPGCKKALQIADQYAGKLLICPQCKTQMTAPRAGGAPAGAPRPASPAAIAPRPGVAAPPVPPAMRPQASPPRPVVGAPRRRSPWPLIGASAALAVILIGGVVAVLATGVFSSTSKETPEDPQQAGGQPPAVAKVSSSLTLVPEDAAFYSAALRNREQIDAIRKSQFWKRLNALPAVQGGWQMLDGPLAPVRKFTNDPANRELMDLLDDMWGQEIFVYGGSGWTDSIRTFKQVYGAGTLANAAGGAMRGPEESIVQALKGLGSGPIRVPELMVGFRLSKPDASGGLKRLETLIREQLKGVPDLDKRLQWQKVGGSDFLVLTLDGKQVPWEQFPVFTQTRGQLDGLMNRLREARLTIGLGVRDGYLLLAIGESTDFVARLGQGKSLAGRAELQPFAKFADQRIADISYVSKALRTETSFTKKDLQGMGESVKAYMPMLQLPPGVQGRVDRDLAALLKDLEKYVPEPGASLSFSFLNGRGLERYSYDWTENLGDDGSKPLGLLNHMGGDPLFLIAGRQKYQPENYQLLLKWLKVVHGYLFDMGIPGMVEPLGYRALFAQFQPVLERLDRATGQLLLPALADGQSGLVIDGKLTSNQWSPMLPPAERPLPLPEVALLLGVSDAAKLKQAGVEYREGINQALDLIGKLNNQPMPSLPPPQMAAVTGGEMFFYPLPPGFVDPRLQPNVAVSSNLAVLTLSREHSERLLKSTPPANDFLRRHAGQPLSAASALNVPATLDLLMAWVDYGARSAGGVRDDQLQQVREAVNLFKVIRSYASVTYFEGGAEVQHSEIVVQDQ
jgi:hypothetical protein